MICFIIITVQSFFSDGEGSLDCKGVVVFDRGSGKVRIDMVHGWYNGRDAGCTSGKKQGRIFEDLRQS